MYFGHGACIAWNRQAFLELQRLRPRRLPNDRNKPCIPPTCQPSNTMRRDHAESPSWLAEKRAQANATMARPPDQDEDYEKSLPDWLIETYRCLRGCRRLAYQDNTRPAQLPSQQGAVHFRSTVIAFPITTSLTSEQRCEINFATSSTSTITSTPSGMSANRHTLCTVFNPFCIISLGQLYFCLVSKRNALLRRRMLRHANAITSSAGASARSQLP